jgi:hypothetical protein
VWDEATKQLVVRVSSLLEYVVKAVKERQLAVDNEFKHLIQIPRSDGERDAAHDPVLASISVAATSVLRDAMRHSRSSGAASNR